jgi:hypothetical protein
MSVAAWAQLAMAGRDIPRIREDVFFRYRR